VLQKSLHDFGSASRCNGFGTNGIGKQLRAISTAIPSEIEKFERIANSWWDPNGEFKALHSMNSLRVKLVKDGLHSNGQIKITKCASPLEGMTLVDVGCGGGILTEPLARLGGNILGIDAGQQNIDVAENHLPDSLKDKVSYKCTTIEDFHLSNPEAQFDGLVVSEVIEHVEQPELFLKVASELVKPRGSIFITTINRTNASWLGAIVAAEYLCRLLPPGTHDWKKFITPEELQSLLNQNNFQTRLIHGMSFNPLNNSWKWTAQTDINYCIHAVKN